MGRPQSPNLSWAQLSVVRTNIEQTPCIQKASAGARGQEPGPDRALWVETTSTLLLPLGVLDAVAQAGAVMVRTCFQVL